MFRDSKKYYQSGFSTLEMLLAMAILVLTLTAVILISFGSQAMAVASQTNSEALNRAQGLLERTQALARKDFKLVNSSQTVDDIYTQKVQVSPVIDPATGKVDYFSKLVAATVSWAGEHGQPLSTSLFTRVTNFNNATGSETCDSVLSPNADAWRTPAVTKAFWDFSNLTGIADNYPVTDVDAYNGKLYVTVDNSGAATTTVPTFFVFDVNNPHTVTAIPNDFVDNNLTVKSGLKAVAVAKDAATQKNYAYVAGATGSAQFQVIDINVVPPVVVPTATINLGAYGFNGVGNSIFYKDGFVYLGLTKNGIGPQFAVIDVHNPLVPQFTGAFTVDNDVNAIYVRNQYAYLATPNSNNLMVLNISNPVSPILTGSFNPGNGVNGKSLSLVGDDLYLGRTVGGTEFYILNNSDSATSSLPVFGSKADIDASVDGIVARSGLDTAVPPVFHNLAFLLTPSQLQILDVTERTNINPWATIALDPSTINTISLEPAIDCEGNQFFIGSNDNGKNGYVSVIAP